MYFVLRPFKYRIVSTASLYDWNTVGWQGRSFSSRARALPRPPFSVMFAASPSPSPAPPHRTALAGVLLCFCAPATDQLNPTDVLRDGANTMRTTRVLHLISIISIIQYRSYRRRARLAFIVHERLQGRRDVKQYGSEKRSFSRQPY